ncbi:MAG: SDR family oxidoreductase [Sulfuriferula sp.]
MGLPPEVVGGTEGQFAGMTPVKSMAQPGEIAEAVVFLASTESSYMVGAELGGAGSGLCPTTYRFFNPNGQLPLIF